MKIFQSPQKIYQEYPKPFWIVVTTTFIDRLGGALIFPFLSLYVTHRFGVGMTEVGYIFAIFAVSSLFGSMLGGALTDKFGRKVMLLFGLITSALSSLALGLVNEIALIYPLSLVVGLLSNTAGPAQQAIVADLLPEEQRREGFGIIRIVVNLAVTIGPAIGGFLAATSYLLLFVSDAVSSLITAVIVWLTLPETRPEIPEGSDEENLMQTIGGYKQIFSDHLFLAFILASIFMITVYMQMNSSLPVYLRDIHDVSTQGYGFILSLNAGMVVLFQFWISRRTSNYAPMILMALGSLLYAVGFTMYGVVNLYALFLFAMVIITIGEMLVVPTGQAVVSILAPPEMRGRYMAMFGLSWTIPAAIGPLIAGIVIDQLNPNWVWYGSGILATIAALIYFALSPLAKQRFSVDHSHPAD